MTLKKLIQRWVTNAPAPTCGGRREDRRKKHQKGRSLIFRISAIFAVFSLGLDACAPLGSKMQHGSDSGVDGEVVMRERLIEIDLAISEWYANQTYAGLDALAQLKLVGIGKSTKPADVLEDQKKLLEYIARNEWLQESREVQGAQREWEKEQQAATECLERVISMRERRSHALKRGIDILDVQAYYLQLLREEKTALEQIVGR